MFRIAASNDSGVGPWSEQLALVIPSYSAAFLRRLREYLLDHVFQDPTDDSSIFKQSTAMLVWRFAFQQLYLNTDWLCYLAFFVCLFVQQDLTSALPVVCILLYALVEPVSPSKRFWVIAIFYVDFIIMVKYFFQLPLFCICRSAEGNSYRLETYCQENKAACHVSPSEQPITYQVDKILGVANQGDEFLQHIIFNVLVLVALLLHRSSMMFQGLWDLGMQDRLQRLAPYALGDDEFSMVSHGSGKSGSRYYVSFWKRVTESDFKLGTDLHFITVTLEFFSFLFLLFGYPSLFSSFADEGLNSNRVSGTMVLLLVAQVTVIVIERVMYLERAIRWKVVMHGVSVVAYIGVIFFLPPSNSNMAFANSSALQFLAFLKISYLILSALQIRSGYPAQTNGQFLCRNTSGTLPTYIFLYSFMLYRAIPFLFELRTLLDWTVTRTTLRFIEWLTIEDIWAILYTKHCDNVVMINEGRSRGDPQEWWFKILAGLLFFLLLLFLLFFPLLFFSNLNPNYHDNPVNTLQLSIGVQGFDLLYGSGSISRPRIVTGEERLNLEKEFSDGNGIRRTVAESTIVQTANISQSSYSVWTISRPGYDRLQQQLGDPTTPSELSVELQFSRDGPPNNRDVRYSSVTTLSPEESQELLQAIRGEKPFVLKNFLPTFWDVRSQGNPMILQPEYTVDCALQLEQDLPFPFWNFSCLRPDLQGGGYGNPLLLLYSEQASTDTSFFSSYGLVAFYTTFVLTVGRFLRMWAADRAKSIIVTALHDCRELMNICMAVAAAREDGNLYMEESFFRELILVYRRPEELMRLSGGEQDQLFMKQVDRTKIDP